MNVLKTIGEALLSAHYLYRVSLSKDESDMLDHQQGDYHLENTLLNSAHYFGKATCLFKFNHNVCSPLSFRPDDTSVKYQMSKYGCVHHPVRKSKLISGVNILDQAAQAFVIVNGCERVSDRGPARDTQHYPLRRHKSGIFISSVAHWDSLHKPLQSSTSEATDSVVNMTLTRKRRFRIRPTKPGNVAITT
nr:unnamed protein product [Callosobruchus analis]